MIAKKSIGEIIFDSINIIFLVGLTVVALYPFLYVAFASVSKASELSAHRGLLLWPLGVDVSSYIMVFKNPMIVRGYANTIFIVTVGTGINILMTSFGAYVLSRKQLFLKKAIMLMVVITMFFSGGLVPFYLTVKGLGLFDSLWAVIIPGSISTMNLIILRTSFQGIPAGLEESAKIDGANDFGILFRIIMPLSKSALAVMVLYYGVAHWNSWFNATIFIRERTSLPLQVILREILIQESMDSMIGAADGVEKFQIAETVRYATIMVATLPVMLVYPFLQKHFVKGVMIGALKG